MCGADWSAANNPGVQAKKRSERQLDWVRRELVVSRYCCATRSQGNIKTNKAQGNPLMSNFSLLSQYDEQLLRLGMLAEKYFADDPNTCLIKLRQLGESLAQMLAARTGLYVAYADRLEARYTAARTQLEKLTSATLAKAFRGELVPQDPNDEPASALLARISASRSDKTRKKFVVKDER